MSPCGAGVGAGQRLHVGQQITEVFGVQALLATGHMTAIGRSMQGGLGQAVAELGIPFGPDRCQVGRDTGLAGLRLVVGLDPKLLREGL